MIFFLSNVFASLRKWFSYYRSCSLSLLKQLSCYRTCSLRFENNFLSVGHVRFRFENSFFAIECVRFASKVIFVLSNVFASFWKLFAYYRRCCFASISKKTPLSKLLFAFVSLALRLLMMISISNEVNWYILWLVESWFPVDDIINDDCYLCWRELIGQLILAMKNLLSILHLL